MSGEKLTCGQILALAIFAAAIIGMFVSIVAVARGMK